MAFALQATIHLGFWTQGLSPAWNSIVGRGRLNSRPQGSTCLHHLPAALEVELGSVHTIPVFLLGFREGELKVPMLAKQVLYQRNHVPPLRQVRVWLDICRRNVNSSTRAGYKDPFGLDRRTDRHSEGQLCQTLGIQASESPRNHRESPAYPSLDTHPGWSIDSVCREDRFHHSG